MNRKMYEFTNGQLKKFERNGTKPLAEMQQTIDKIQAGEMDNELRERWAKAHHGKTNGWGMGKRAAIVSLLQGTIEYQRGLWQGRVDKANGIGYSEERNENAYNMGYYRGYDEYESNRRGWDRETRARFDEKYLTD